MLDYDGEGSFHKGDENMSKASFAAQLRQVREKAGLSQYGLAKRTGLTRQAVWQLEMGESEPSWTTVQLLALALAVDYDALADPDLELPDAGPVKSRGRPRKQESEATDEGKPKQTRKRKNH